MSPDAQSTPAGGLAGMVIGVPAARRAGETARLIERWGGTPLVGPTVEEVEVDDLEPVIEATRQVIDGPAAWSIFLTGVGTRRWFAMAQEAALLDPLLSALSSARLIARGLKASSALRAFSLEPEWTPEGETSKEIAAWIEDKITEGQLVALQRHGEPVAGLAGRVVACGGRLVEIVTYRWEIPADRKPACELVRALTEDRVQALVITSAPQLRNLFRVAQDLGLQESLHDALRERVYLASVGVVASGALEERGLRPDLVAKPPRLGALLRSLAAARGDVLRKAGVEQERVV